MKTYMAKPGEVEQKWHTIDATDQVVGRLASRIAVLLMGKHRPNTRRTLIRAISSS